MTTPRAKVTRIVATLAIAFAAIYALNGLAPEIDFAQLLTAFAIFIPGAWWYYCDSQDKKATADYEQSAKAHAASREHLDPVIDHALLAALGDSVPTPKPFRRRWGWVFFASFVLLAVAQIVAPAAPATSEPDKPTETSAETTVEVTTTSSELTTSSTTSSSTTSAQPSSTASSTTTTVEPTPEPTSTEPVEEPYVEEVYQAPLPEPTPTPTPQQFYQQPAAPVIQESPSVYYQNCDAVRAAGAAPLYIGSPGYAPKLDRDGDGIACE